MLSMTVCAVAGGSSAHIIKEKGTLGRYFIMKNHIVIDGNAFYEIDEECMRQKESEKRQQKNRRTGDMTNRNAGKKQERK